MAKKKAEQADEAQTEAVEETTAEAPKKKATKKKATKKKATKRKTKKAAEAEVRVRLFWGVFSPTMKRVAVFHYDQKDLAQKKAKDLSDSKSPHFVAKIKEPIEEVV